MRRVSDTRGTGSNQSQRGHTLGGRRNVQDLWGDADNRTRVPDRFGDVRHEALHLQAPKGGEEAHGGGAMAVKPADSAGSAAEGLMSRLAQRFLRWLFVFGLLALVRTCLVLTGCAIMPAQQAGHDKRQALTHQAT